MTTIRISMLSECWYHSLLSSRQSDKTRILQYASTKLENKLHWAGPANEWLAVARSTE